MGTKTVKPNIAVRRLRFTVPEDDVSVIEFIERQYNLSYSLRTIIKDWIQRNGSGDATCDTVQKINRGRPSKALEAAMRQNDEYFSGMADQQPASGDAHVAAGQDQPADVTLGTPRAGMSMSAPGPVPSVESVQGALSQAAPTLDGGAADRAKRMLDF